MRELQGNAVGEARTVRAASARRGFVVATLAALAMILTGGFGTGGMPLAMRAAYWLIIMEAGALIGIAVTTGVHSWGRLAHNYWLEGIAVSALIALPLTLVVLVVTLAFRGGWTINLASLAILFCMVFAVTAMISAVNYATAKPALPEPVAPPQPATPGLSDRLARHLRGAAIHALQAEDHYLRVHTEAGSELILMRITDAIPLLAPLEGARTHRSWWVARAAIQSAARRHGRAELTLPGGVVAPVSRSAYPELRDAGWFN